MCILRDIDISIFVQRLLKSGLFKTSIKIVQSDLKYLENFSKLYFKCQQTRAWWFAMMYSILITWSGSQCSSVLTWQCTYYRMFAGSSFVPKAQYGPFSKLISILLAVGREGVRPVVGTSSLWSWSHHHHHHHRSSQIIFKLSLGCFAVMRPEVRGLQSPQCRLTISLCLSVVLILSVQSRNGSLFPHCCRFRMEAELSCQL